MRMLFASSGKYGSAWSSCAKRTPPLVSSSVTLQFFAMTFLLATSMVTLQTSRGKCIALRMLAAMSVCPGGPGCTASPPVIRSLGSVARGLCITSR